MMSLVQALKEGRIPCSELGIIISNRDEAKGLDYCKANDLPYEIVSEQKASERDASILSLLTEHKIDLVLLAGYDRIISDALLDAFPNRILNIHPSLLPAYGGKGMVGMNVHKAVIENNERHSGCTVHIVTKDVDAGPILGHAEVNVLPNDTPESLADRVLLAEHRLYPDTIAEIITSLVMEELEEEKQNQNQR